MSRGYHVMQTVCEPGFKTKDIKGPECHVITTKDIKGTECHVVIT